jgi:hypothetical protein
MTQPATQPPTPTAEEKAAAVQAAAQLASRLRYLTQQEGQIERQKKEVKEALEKLHKANLIAAKDSFDILYNDGTTKKVQLSREGTGTYFKVGEEYKDEFSADAARLQARYIKAGKGSIVEKAHTWKTRELK